MMLRPSSSTLPHTLLPYTTLFRSGDGQTDGMPVNWSSQFDWNWELSQAGALAVVLQLIDLGIPPQRLMAAGFGEHQPIEPGDDELSHRRHRRNEFQLTER